MNEFAQCQPEENFKDCFAIILLYSPGRMRTGVCGIADKVAAEPGEDNAEMIERNCEGARSEAGLLSGQLITGIVQVQACQNCCHCKRVWLRRTSLLPAPWYVSIVWLMSPSAACEPRLSGPQAGEPDPQ